MDPEKTLSQMLDAFLCNDRQEAVAAGSDLLQWLNHEGFTPPITGLTEAQVRALIEMACCGATHLYVIDD